MDIDFIGPREGIWRVAAARRPAVGRGRGKVKGRVPRLHRRRRRWRQQSEGVRVSACTERVVQRAPRDVSRSGGLDVARVGIDVAPGGRAPFGHGRRVDVAFARGGVARRREVQVVRRAVVQAVVGRVLIGESADPHLEMCAVAIEAHVGWVRLEACAVERLRGRQRWLGGRRGRHCWRQRWQRRRQGRHRGRRRWQCGRRRRHCWRQRWRCRRRRWRRRLEGDGKAHGVVKPETEGVPFAGPAGRRPLDPIPALGPHCVEHAERADARPHRVHGRVGCAPFNGLDEAVARERP